MPNPLLSQDAIRLIAEWLHQPTARIIVFTSEHWAVFKELLEPLGMAGNLTSDAHLAALAIEHGVYLTGSHFRQGTSDSFKVRLRDAPSRRAVNHVKAMSRVPELTAAPK